MHVIHNAINGEWNAFKSYKDFRESNFTSGLLTIQRIHNNNNNYINNNKIRMCGMWHRRMNVHTCVHRLLLLSFVSPNNYAVLETGIIQNNNRATKVCFYKLLMHLSLGCCMCDGNVLNPFNFIYRFTSWKLYNCRFLKISLRKCLKQFLTLLLFMYIRRRFGNFLA